MWVDLIHDKFIGDNKGNGDHTHVNEHTNKITIESLNDGSYTYYEAESAVKFYNNRFMHHKGFLLPKCLSEFPLFRVKVYEKEQSNGTTVIIVLVGIDVELLEKYYMQKTIPDDKFFRGLCTWHLSYTKASELANYFHKTDKEILTKNMEYIGSTAIKAVDYVFDPTIPENDVLHKYLNIKLFQYQSCSIQWMINKEQKPHKISYTYNDTIQFGNLYYDHYSQSLELESNKDVITFYGGALIDEVGLGKTIQIISLILKNKRKNVEYIEKGCTKLVSNATLVLCPNQLCGQWIRECTGRIRKEHKMNLIAIMTKKDFDKISYGDLLEADIVLVSFNFLNNPAFKIKWLSQMSTNKSFNNNSWSSTDHTKAQSIFKRMSDELIESPFESIFIKNPLIQLIKWHRIVIDEFHEIYKEGVVKYVHNLLPYLESNHRWVVSATPFINETCTHAITQFLTNFQNGTTIGPECNGKDIYSVSDIVEYLSFNCYRRNTKDSVEKEHTLPEIVEEVRWLKFSQTESLMYNAHLTNKFNDKAGIYLRKLCCHPQLAEETKSVLANCKTLDDVEKNIVKYYQDEVNIQQVKVNKIEERVEKCTIKVEMIRIHVLKKEAIRLGLLKKPKNKQDQNIDTILDKLQSDQIDGIFEDSTDIPVDSIENTPEILAIIEELKNKEKILSDSATFQNIVTYLGKLKSDLVEASAILQGKQSTYTFFNNVLSRLGKIIERSERRDMGEEFDEDDEDCETCGICLDEISGEELGVTICGHLFCYECLIAVIHKQGKCPYCKRVLKSTDIYSLAYEKKQKETIEPQSQSKIDLINSVGTKLANLILYLKDTSKHIIIFSQWEDLLIRVGYILKSNGIPNVFCRGNCYQRDKAIRDFNSDDKIKVIMLSSSSSASGTNLTKASRIVFIEPIYGSYEFRRNQERQAVGRAHRLGQLNQIKVIRFLVKHTIENDIYEMNMEQNSKHEPIFKKTICYNTNGQIM